MKLELEQLLELDCETRYDYSLSAISDDREVWIIVNEEREFLKIYSEEEELEYLPIWPSAESAKYYCGKDDSLQPKRLDLPDFFKKWVSGLQRDGIDVGVFPGADATVWITSPIEFKEELQEEMSQF